MKRTENNQGFTLIEVLITTAILAFVLVVVFSIYFFGDKTFNLGSDRRLIQSDVRLATDYISNEVRYASEISLLDTSPSSLSNDDPYNYIYINNGALCVSIYNNGGARITSSFGSTLLSTSYFSASGSSGFQELAYVIKAAKGTRTYEMSSKITMPNIKSAAFVTGTSKPALKYKKP